MSTSNNVYDTYMSLVMAGYTEELTDYEDCLYGDSVISLNESDIATFENHAIEHNRTIDITSIYIDSFCNIRTQFNSILQKYSDRDCLLMLSGQNVMQLLHEIMNIIDECGMHNNILLAVKDGGPKCGYLRLTSIAY